jgi:hypothetical protein
MTRKKTGPAPWTPTEDERRLVEHYVTLGYTQEQIASLMGKSVDSLARHCRDELDNGALKVNAKIGGKLFQKAMSGDTTALIFWCKTRMGWKETSGLDLNMRRPVEINLSRKSSG